MVQGGWRDLGIVEGGEEPGDEARRGAPAGVLLEVMEHAAADALEVARNLADIAIGVEELGQELLDDLADAVVVLDGPDQVAVLLGDLDLVAGLLEVDQQRGRKRNARIGSPSHRVCPVYPGGAAWR